MWVYIKIWYNTSVIITKSGPYTKEEIEKLREQFDIYIKTVIDVNKKICSALSSCCFIARSYLSGII